MVPSTHPSSVVRKLWTINDMPIHMLIATASEEMAKALVRSWLISPLRPKLREKSRQGRCRLSWTMSMGLSRASAKRESRARMKPLGFQLSVTPSQRIRHRAMPAQAARAVRFAKAWLPSEKEAPMNRRWGS